MRYIIIPESVSCHCCFQFTIIDTAAGKMSLGGTEYWNRTMCECFDEEEAKIICNALNNIHEKTKEKENETKERL